MKNIIKIFPCFIDNFTFAITAKLVLADDNITALVLAIVSAKMLTPKMRQWVG